ncbi:MAG: Hpt domain-containing protein, partial [Planctomycetia bacterium]
MEDLSGLSMLELFRQEADAQTATLSSGVLALEDAAPAAAAIEPLMRAAHSLKGAARIIGLAPAVTVAHALEDAFVRAGRSPHPVRGNQADAVLEAIDFLAAIGHAADAMAAESPWAARAERLVGRLAAVGETARQSPTPAEAETSVAAIALTEAPLKQAPAPAATSDPVRASEPACATGGTRAPEVSPEQPIREATAAVPSYDPDSTDSGERVVRVTADSLSRLLGLVGEALVEARQFEPVAVGLAGLRSAQARLCQSLAAVER